MSAGEILAFVAIVAVNLPINAGVLWLACRLLRVGHEARGIPYRRAFNLTLVIFSVGWAVLSVVVLTLRQFSAAPLLDLLFWSLIPLGVVVPLPILKWGLAARWWSAFAVWLVWRVLGLAHLLPTWLVVGDSVLDALGR